MINGKFKNILAVLLFILITVSKGEEHSNIQAAFLDIGIGARAMGLGGAYSSLASGADASVWNPAGLIEQQTMHNSAFENITMFDLYNYNFLSYSYKKDDLMGFGISGIYSGGDDMSETTILLTSSLNMEYFNSWNSIPEELRILLYQFSAGFNLKYYYSSFGNNEDGEYLQDGEQLQNQGSANGLGADFGLKFFLDEKNTFSFMSRNMISTISWSTSRQAGDYNQNLPAQLIFGYNYQQEFLIFALDYDKALHGDTDDYISMGMEYLFLDKSLAARAGYSQELLTGDNKHYAFGIGYSIKDWYSDTITIDVSYEINTSWEEYNNLRFSLKLSL